MEFSATYMRMTLNYVSFKSDLSDELQMAKSKVELCARDIYTWMGHNGLRLNQEKSDLFVFTYKFLVEPDLNCINDVDECNISVSSA